MSERKWQRRMGMVAAACAMAAWSPPSWAARSGASCLSPPHFFRFEDSTGVLADPTHGNQDVYDLLAAAHNALVAERGGAFDFVGFWVDFEPARKIGGAFHRSVANEVKGIGRPIFDHHALFGLAPSEIQGLIMMYDMHRTRGGRTARNALKHEIAHRWAAYLPPLAPGKPMQSTTNASHFICRLDAQGGVMVGNWEGESPARLTSTKGNLDTGGNYSLLTLYLMGYVSPAELDDLSTELRYMDDNVDCLARYDGPITHFGSADLEAVAGVRVPDSRATQKHFRFAWVVIHAPGETPTDRSLGKIAKILDEQAEAWPHDTLGRGTVSHLLFDDCNCNGTPDAEDILSGASTDEDGDGVPDECRG